MTLQNQAERAKKLQLVEIPGSKNHIFGTIGSSGDHYQMEVSEYADTYEFGNMLRGVTVFSVDCQQAKANISNGKASMQVACKGNCQKHTICYHSQAALLKVFTGKKISFQRSISDETARSGNISLAKSPEGGELWIVEQKEVGTEIKVQNKPIVNLMRGTVEEDEGID